MRFTTQDIISLAGLALIFIASGLLLVVLATYH